MARQLSRRALEPEIEATYDPHFIGLRPQLVELIRELQRASTPEDYMRLQLGLRDRFAARQDAMAQRRERSPPTRQNSAASHR